MAVGEVLVTCVAGVNGGHGEMNDSFSSSFCLSSFFLDSFVNSQEWTLSRSVPELKVVSEFYYFEFYFIVLNASLWDPSSTYEGTGSDWPDSSLARSG